MRRPGPDSTLDDVRVKLIEAGTELLRERGVDLGLAEISLSDAIAKAQVTRSTAYRSLAHDELAPQAVLHRALLDNLLSQYGRGETRTGIENAITAELELHADAMTDGTTADRTHALRAIIRVGANCSYTNAVESSERSILTAMYGALRSSADASDWRHEALTEGERSLNDMFTSLHTGLASLFHYQMKPPVTMAQFSAAAASLIEGMAMRHGFNDEVVMIDRPTGPAGSPQEWSLFAVALEALFIGMCEPDDHLTPFADLTRH